MFKIIIPIGDWSNDGHGKCIEHIIMSSYSAFDLQEAYKDSCKLTGVQFHNGVNYTGLTLSGYRSDRYICTEYAENKISETAIESLVEYGLDDKQLVEDRYFEGTHHFVETLLWFIGLSMPSDFHYEFAKKDGEYLNGYWNNNLNVQFGYGLFY